MFIDIYPIINFYDYKSGHLSEEKSILILQIIHSYNL